MATEILRPHDCLAKRIGASPGAYPRRRSCSYENSCSNPRPNRKQYQHQQRKRSVTGQSEPTVSIRSNPDEAGAARPAAADLVMGKVTILRRGEPLDAAVKDDAGPKREGGGPVVSGSGSGPEMVRKQVIAPELRSPAVAAGGKPVVYAGSAFAVSPEPSSLPLPSFSNKKKKKQVLLVDDSATRDLRRILRLDLL